MKVTDRRFLGLVALLLVVTGCGQPDAEETVPTPQVEVTEPVIEATVEAPVLPEATQATIEELRAIAASNSLRRLSRFAMAQPNFRSTIGTENPYEHWYLLKRAGMDPAEKLVEILDYPFVEKDFGDEVLYIWPYLADRPSEDLVEARLSFRERADLLALVGAQGVEDLENGAAYPGFRTAISSTGEWRYFVHTR